MQKTNEDGSQATKGIEGTENNDPSQALLPRASTHISVNSANEEDEDREEKKLILSQPLMEKRMSLLTARLQAHSSLTSSNTRLRAIYSWLGLKTFGHFLLSKPAGLFIYSMLMYRLGLLMLNETVDYEDMENTFSAKSSVGLQSIAVPLTEIPQGQAVGWTFGVPLGLLLLYSAYSAYPLHRRGEIQLTSARLEKLHEEIDSYLTSLNTSWSREFLAVDYLLEITEIYSISSKMTTLKNALLWQGQLSQKEREEALDLIIRVAEQGKKNVQLAAIAALGEIAGSGVRITTKNSAEQNGLINVEREKAITALRTLQPVKRRAGFSKWLNSIPRSLLAGFLLWAMNEQSYNAGSLLFFYRWGQAGWEAYFLAKVINTIKAVLACPEKPGFNFGIGYSDWSGDYTVDCFDAAVRLFRSTNPTEPISDINFSKFHLTGLTQLDLSDKYLTDEELQIFIEGVTAQGAALTYLDLSNNDLTSPQLETLPGLTELTYLDLSHNNLSSLSDLPRLPQLTTLDVSSNPRITVIKDDDFEMDNLESFTASDCGISEINQPFVGMGHLQSLDLSGNPIGPRLSTITFKGLNQLSDLRLSDTQLADDIDPDIFDSVSDLRTLDLSDNQFTALENPALFDNLSSLTEVYLSGNSLTSLHIDLLSSQIQLQILDLSNNHLADLPDDLFRNTLALTTVDLSLNKFQIISPDLFKGLTKLVTLVLSANQFREFHQDSFTYLTGLQSLDLSVNSIGFPSLIRQLPTFPTTLRQLLLSYNQITHLPQNFTDMLPPQLEELDLSYNPLPAFDLTADFTQQFPLTLTTLNLASLSIKSVENRAFINFSQLIELDMSSNLLIEIGSEAFSNPSLQTLYISDNSITNISESAFYSCKSLVTISLDLNDIDKIEPDTFRYLPFLNYLSIQNNKLTDMGFMAGSTGGFASLQTLILARNQIAEVPSLQLPALQKLDLSHNNITLLQNPLQGAPNLSELILSYNPLGIATSGTFNLPKLQTLEADSCQFSDITVQNLTMSFPYKSLKELGLPRNYIGPSGMNMLSQVAACSELDAIDLDGNPADPTTVDMNQANKILYIACDGQVCSGTALTSPDCVTPLVPTTLEASSQTVYAPADTSLQQVQKFVTTSSLPAGVVIAAWLLSMARHNYWVKMLGKGFSKLFCKSSSDAEAKEVELPVHRVPNSYMIWRAEKATETPLITVKAEQIKPTR